MTSAFDQRIVTIGLDFGNGPVSLEGLSVQAVGRKYGSAVMNECQCRIYNLTKEQQNYILTQASPLKKNRTPINMTLDVGRESYGTFRLFEGAVFQCGATQPPDIGIVLRSLTSNYQLGVIAGTSQAATALLSAIAASIAKNNGLTLVFEATDKQIANFTCNGSVAKQVNRLGQAGGVDAFVDNNKLVVIDSNKYRKGTTRAHQRRHGHGGHPAGDRFGGAGAGDDGQLHRAGRQHRGAERDEPRRQRYLQGRAGQLRSGQPRHAFLVHATVQQFRILSRQLNG